MWLKGKHLHFLLPVRDTCGFHATITGMLLSAVRALNITVPGCNLGGKAATGVVAALGAILIGGCDQ